MFHRFVSSAPIRPSLTKPLVARLLQQAPNRSQSNRRDREGPQMSPIDMRDAIASATLQNQEDRRRRDLGQEQSAVEKTMRSAAMSGGLKLISDSSARLDDEDAVLLKGDASRPAFSAAKKAASIYPAEAIRLRRRRDEASTPSVPSVTKILKETMPIENQLALKKWEARMVAEMGREAFDQMRNRTLRRGHALHAHVERVLLGNAEADEGPDDGDEVACRLVESVQPVMTHFSRPFAIESRVAHGELNYMVVQYDEFWSFSHRH